MEPGKRKKYTNKASPGGMSCRNLIDTTDSGSLSTCFTGVVPGNVPLCRGRTIPIAKPPSIRGRIYRCNSPFRFSRSPSGYVVPLPGKTLFWRRRTNDFPSATIDAWKYGLLRQTRQTVFHRILLRANVRRPRNRIQRRRYGCFRPTHSPSLWYAIPDRLTSGRERTVRPRYNTTTKRNRLPVGPGRHNAPVRRFATLKPGNKRPWKHRERLPYLRNSHPGSMKNNPNGRSVLFPGSLPSVWPRQVSNIPCIRFSHSGCLRPCWSLFKTFANRRVSRS